MIPRIDGRDPKRSRPLSAGGHIGVRHEAGAGLRLINAAARWARVSPVEGNGFFALDKGFGVVYTRTKARLDQDAKWVRCDRQGGEGSEAGFREPRPGRRGPVPRPQQRDPLCEKRPERFAGTPAVRSIVKRGYSTRMSLYRIGGTNMSGSGLDPMCWPDVLARCAGPACWPGMLAT